MGISRYKQVAPVTFGIGSRKLIAERLRDYNCTKVVFVTDQGMVKTGYVDEIKNNLEDANIEVVIFDKVEADPSDTLCEKAGKFALEEKVDGIVCLGGGSSIDVGKAIKILSANPYPISQYYRSLDYKKGIPLIMVPTTSGTGSEVSNVAVINDTASGNKLALFVSGDEAICDPELTYKLPKSLTISTGLDAFAHAADALTGNKPNPHSSVLAVHAISLITRFLPIVAIEPMNEEARTNMMLASNFAGIAFADTSTHLSHAIGQSLGAKFHIAHGVTCAWCLPETMRYSSRYVPEKIKLILNAMGIKYSSKATNEEIGQLIFDSIMGLIKTLEFITPNQMGIEKQQFVDIIDMIHKSGAFPYAPKAPTDEELIEMLNKIYEDYESLYK